MTSNLAQQAVSLALSGNWKDAIKANQEIIANNPNDTDALNRLARAYYESGNIKKALATARKVLKLDHFNTIAKKSIGRWENIRQSDVVGKTTPQSVIPGFLEEPGKTKTVNLIHLGASDVLSELNSGDEAKLGTSGHRINILTLGENKFVGRLPDDLSARIRHLMSRGNKYKAFIKSVSYSPDGKPTNACVFIKEVKKVKGLEDIPSFSSEKIDYIAFTSPQAVTKRGKIQFQED